MPDLTEISTTCCIVGGGPAGMMLGFLLARAGIDVLVLEKHGDFLRDFRGDTVHPSTLELMYELGILKDFLACPHQKISELGGQFGRDFLRLVSFSQLKTQCKFIAMMPQWDFLNFLEQKARCYPSFSLLMNTDARDLIEESGRITGVIARTQTSKLHIKAHLVIGADGRNSLVRERAGLPVEDVGAPMDVLWMRLSRKPTDPQQSLGRVIPGLLFVMLNRNEYWQCGYIIPKGKAEEVRQKGIEKLRARIAEAAPFVSDRTDELTSWDDIKLLTVKVDRLTKWYRQGLLCIGDAAHAMSPIAGVGINLAIQDAVATANLLYQPLSKKHCLAEDLEKVQKRRTYPTHMTQRLQVAIQNSFIQTVLKQEAPISAPLPMRLLTAIPAVRSIAGQIIGVGFRPEHIQTPENASKMGANLSRKT